MFGPARNPAFSAAAVLIVVGLVLAFELQPIGRERPGVALALAFLAIVPPTVALARLSAAGCGALAAGAALWGLARALGRPPLDAVLLFAAPGWVALVWEHAVLVLLARRERLRGLAAVEAAGEAKDVAPYLAHPALEVRQLAARRLGAVFPASASFPLLSEASRSPDPDEREAAYGALRSLAHHPEGRTQVHELLRDRARDPDDERAAQAARALAQLDLLSDILMSEAPGEERPRVRLGYVEGLLSATAASDGTGTRSSLAATLLAQVLASEAAAAELRLSALELMDRLPPREARAAVVPLLVRDQVTPELLALFDEQGVAEDAPFLARWVGVDQHEVCEAAVGALEATKDRTPDLGPHAAATRAALEAGKARLRAVHPPGDNPLADILVERIDALSKQVSPARAPG